MRATSWLLRYMRGLKCGVHTRDSFFDGNECSLTAERYKPLPIKIENFDFAL